jgi:hypothetical protein
LVQDSADECFYRGDHPLEHPVHYTTASGQEENRIPLGQATAENPGFPGFHKYSISDENPSDRMAPHPPILPSKSRARGPPISRSVFLLKEPFRNTGDFTGKEAGGRYDDH